MPSSNSITKSAKPAGYVALTERYGLDVIPNWHRSYVSWVGVRRVDVLGTAVEETYSARYWPGDSLAGQLEFALKYDGVNLGILAALFDVVDRGELLEYIRSKPSGKYARQIWFLYELLTGTALPLENLTFGNYVDLIDPTRYYAVRAARKVRRQRINDNLLGGSRFCPMVRRTDAIRVLENSDLAQRVRELVANYSPELLKRALSYLYTKETKSSFEIERVQPTSNRVERFIASLQLAEREDFCERSRLIELQNLVVDPRFRNTDYRATQNYVGESVDMGRERVHYVAPRPQDLEDLMTGLVEAHQCLERGAVPAVVHAATVAYGFVFLHPFDDGNGRIHRFLIHNILARRGFTPQGLMFPVSAAMLQAAAEYDASLEAFSRSLLSHVDYTLDGEGQMTVHNDTARLYRYMDMTAQVEALYRFIEQTSNTILIEELAFLAHYDETKKAIQRIVDLPDRKIDLFIRFCLQNNGRLSARKRTDQFDFLSDDELAQMEQAFQAAYRRTS